MFSPACARSLLQSSASRQHARASRPSARARQSARRQTPPTSSAASPVAETSSRRSRARCARCTAAVRWSPSRPRRPSCSRRASTSRTPTAGAVSPPRAATPPDALAVPRPRRRLSGWRSTASGRRRRRRSRAVRRSRLASPTLAHGPHCLPASLSPTLAHRPHPALLCSPPAPPPPRCSGPLLSLVSLPPCLSIVITVVAPRSTTYAHSALSTPGWISPYLPHISPTSRHPGVDLPISPPYLPGVGAREKGTEGHTGGRSSPGGNGA